MNAWLQEETKEANEIVEQNFEDNFAPNSTNTKEFKKLDDSEEYLFRLENKLKKIKKNSGVLSQLKEKRNECINNLLNNSTTLTTDKDIELEESIESNKIISHLLPAQPHIKSEIVHLINHDQLDQQKQEDEEETEVKVEQQE